MPQTAYKTKRMKLLFTKGAAFYAFFNLRLFFFLLINKADVLLANDLDTLHANAWARKFKSNCKLIYDSHEYFTGVPELIERPKVQKFWKKIERKHLPKVDEMYTVNDSIAKLYKDEYGVEMKVVRNIVERGDRFFVLSNDKSALPGAAASTWRALFDLKGRFVSVSLYGLSEQPIPAQEGLAAVEAQVDQLIAANGS